MYMYLNKIRFLKNAKNIEIISEGYSDAYKYSFEKDGNKYFLKIGKFKINKNIENILNESKISHPKIIEIDKFDGEYNYIIEEYIEGNNLKYQLDKYDNKFIYEYGFKIGSEYQKLREVYPDIPMTDDKYIEYISMVKERINKLKQLLITNQNDLDKVIIKFLNNTFDYLEKNAYLIKNSSLVFGHTDIKPSNFLIIDKKIIATDIEYTDYKELSLSMLWSFARGDFNDEKNLSFASGYINALYNFDIPNSILKCFDYTYLFNVMGYSIRYIENNEFNKLLTLINHINKKYIINGQIKVSNRLKSTIDFKKIGILNNSLINIVDGSYSPNNLTFKCKTDNNIYFLKVMKTTDIIYNDIKSFRDVLNKYNIPTVPIIESGCFLKNKCYYTVSKYIEFEEIDKSIENTFSEGFRIGQLVASYFIDLKNENIKTDKVYSKDNLYKDIMNDVEFIYSNNINLNTFPWNRDDIINYIKQYIVSFEEENINLIHGDVKFGNILYGNGNIYFIDYETFKYSYDTINFMYNIHIGFLYKDNECYKGFVNGYLNFMNNGKIPYRVQNQAKLLFIYYVIRSIRRVLENRNDNNKIKILINSFKKYIDEGNDIEWLK